MQEKVKTYSNSIKKEVMNRSKIIHLLLTDKAKNGISIYL